MRPLITCSCLLLALTFSACKKKDPAQKVAPASNQGNTGNSTVYYTEYEAGTEINSISGTSVHPGYPITIYLPIDTTCSIDIVIPGIEGIAFRITARNYFKRISVSSPSANYNYHISIEPLHPGLSVPGAGCVSLKVAGEEAGIPSDGLFYGSQIVSNRSNIYCAWRTSGEQYIPFRYKINDQSHFGWILIEPVGLNGVRIKSAALKRINNVPIRCGQKS